MHYVLRMLDKSPSVAQLKSDSQIISLRVIIFNTFRLSIHLSIEVPIIEL